MLPSSVAGLFSGGDLLVVNRQRVRRLERIVMRRRVLQARDESRQSTSISGLEPALAQPIVEQLMADDASMLLVAVMSIGAVRATFWDTLALVLTAGGRRHVGYCGVTRRV